MESENVIVGPSGKGCKVLEAAKKLGDSFVSFERFGEMVKEVEGIELAIQNFTTNNATNLKYPPYPYKDKFDGPVENLVSERILPLIRQAI